MSGGGMGGVPQLQTPFQGQYPVQRFADGGSTGYEDLGNSLPSTWGTSAQDTYNRVIALGSSPEYQAYWDSLPDHLRAYATPPATGPNDPNWTYAASQQMNQWEVSQGEDPFPKQTPASRPSRQRPPAPVPVPKPGGPDNPPLPNKPPPYVPPPTAPQIPTVDFNKRPTGGGGLPPPATPTPNTPPPMTADFGRPFLPEQLQMLRAMYGLPDAAQRGEGQAPSVGSRGGGSEGIAGLMK